MDSKGLVIIYEHTGEVVAPKTLITLIDKSTAILRGTDRALGGTETAKLSVLWRITDIHMHSPLHITYRGSQLVKSRPMRPAEQAAVEDFARLQRGEKPRYFTPRMQDDAKELLAVAFKEGGRMRFMFGDKESCVDSQVITNITTLARPYHEVGSIEGRLEVIDVHKREAVKVWDVRFNIPVTCIVSDVQIEQAKLLLKHRVRVRGRILHEHGRPKEVSDVFDIRQLGGADKLARIEDIAPVDLTGGREPADYLRGDEE